MAVTDDLHALLRRAGINTPVVLVGHSAGGLYATLYADRFPADVAGLVLIDPSVANAPQPPGQSQAQRDANFEASKVWFQSCADLARAGQLSLATPHDCIGKFPPERTPMEREYEAKQFGRPSQWESGLSEMISSTPSSSAPDENSLEEVRASRSYGAMPVVVLTHGRKEASPEMEAVRLAMKARHEQLAARSSRGESRVVPGSGHLIQVDQPDAVVDAIRKVVAEVREEQRSH
jgi:pimeloyl-ACP methyl ester carboxylesterase